MTRSFLSGSLATALLLSIGSINSVFAQHNGGGHHGGGGMHHGGGGSYHGGGSMYHGGGYGGGTHHHHNSGVGSIYIGSGGIGFGYGSYPYGGYGGYYGGYGSGLGYSTGYRGYPSSVYYNNSYPVYRSNVYVPRYSTPYVYQSPTPVVGASSPTVQSLAVTPDSIATPSSELPGVTFGARANINRLADAVAQRTNALCVTLHESYSANPQFNEVYRDTYMMITLSKQLLESGSDPQTTLGIVAELNGVLANVTPAIERFQPAGSSSVSATSLLSRVASAIKLLSVDAGWDGQLPNRSSVAPPPANSAPPVAPPPAPAGSAGEPTLVDPPVPAP